ncbi:hypothetical protein EI42_05912 [Thermosporothrix hazakensis]|jgi:hypothetical protein|uniref:Uncharacterized protein n=1 Tax=Thermosporothrix hazakensis TaxID=644383 RepID=A0A326TWK8_THEHA|nr:hypothetical protein EI42_05912 [Thermosporothrix hazakensis]
MFYALYFLLWLLVLFLSVLLLLVYRHFGFLALGTVEGVQPFIGIYLWSCIWKYAGVRNIGWSLECFLSITPGAPYEALRLSRRICFMVESVLAFCGSSIACILNMELRLKHRDRNPYV